MTEKELRSKAKDIVKFKQHLFMYLLINAGLFGINYLDNGYLNWAYFVVLGWGVGILSHYISLKSGGIFSVEKEMERLKKSQG
ncbi:MAG: 2TM domain-containing protein [Flavobacteriaceae bacterium]|nr:2TM domain-containing protein [Flavobacteriaceae bacterium]MDG1965138.1 2TM domain-containing protein [Flavobacteriaceae bacterium]